MISELIIYVLLGNTPVGEIKDGYDNNQMCTSIVNRAEFISTGPSTIVLKCSEKEGYISNKRAVFTGNWKGLMFMVNAERVSIVRKSFIYNNKESCLKNMELKKRRLLLDTTDEIVGLCIPEGA